MDIFGDLRDWGRVLGLIEGTRKDDRLDEHQEGLARILRYLDNWRLREAVLECFQNVRSPSPELVSAVLAILLDQNVYCDARVLSASALGCLADRTGGGAGLDRNEILEKLRDVLNTPQVPVLNNAVKQALARLSKG